MTSESLQKRKRAVQLLTYYLSSTRVAAGLSWDGDNDAEVDEIVGAIIDAVAAKVRIVLPGEEG